MVLAPWTGRVPGGEFASRARRWRMPNTGPDGSAAFGIVNRLPWTVLDRGPDSVRLERDVGAGEGGWPWAFRARVRYELGDDELRAEMAITSRSNSPMPLGFGFAPLWRRRLMSDADEVTIEVGGGAARRLDAASELDRCIVSVPGSGTIQWSQSGVVATWSSSPEFTRVVVRTRWVDARGGGRTPAGEFELGPVTADPSGFEVRSREEPGGGPAELPSGETRRGVWSVRVARMG